MAKMTSKERITRAMKMEDVDYIPCSIYFNSNLKVDGYDLNTKKDHIKLANDLGVDPVVNISFTLSPQEEVKTETYTEKVNGSQILRQTWHTPAGDLVQEIKLTPEINNWKTIHWDDFSASNIFKPLIVKPDDLEKFSYLIQPPKEKHYQDALSKWGESIELAKKYSIPLVMTYGQGLANLMFMMGAENVIYFCIDYPEAFKELAEIVHQTELAKIEFAARAGVDILKRFGGYETTNFFNPEIFRDIVKPKLKKEVAKAHEFGLLIYYRVVTGMEPILDDIAEIGFDCIEGGEPHLSNCNMEMWNSAFSGQACSWTGISTPVILGGNSTEKVRKEVRKCIEIFGNRGFIMGVTNSIRKHFPWENTLAMVDEWKKIGKF